MPSILSTCVIISAILQTRLGEAGDPKQLDVDPLIFSSFLTTLTEFTFPKIPDLTALCVDIVTHPKDSTPLNLNPSEEETLEAFQIVDAFHQKLLMPEGDPSRSVCVQVINNLNFKMGVNIAPERCFDPLMNGQGTDEEKWPSFTRCIQEVSKDQTDYLLYFYLYFMKMFQLLGEEKDAMNKVVAPFFGSIPGFEMATLRGRRGGRPAQEDEQKAYLINAIIYLAAEAPRNIFQNILTSKMMGWTPVGSFRMVESAGQVI